MVGYATDEDDLLSRLRKIEGQVRGVAQMIEADRKLTEATAAVQRLLRS